MDNLLESNERTLVLFDAVCSGLAECLALVHSDIRQMTEHRNQLELQLHQQQTPQLLQTAQHQQHNKQPRSKHCSSCVTRNNDSQTGNCYEQVLTNNIIMNYKSEHPSELDTRTTSPALPDQQQQQPQQQHPPSDDNDPHHFAHLKLLDKRLADTFSQALSMCDQQAATKQQHQPKNHPHQSANKPSIFQVLLGKSNSSSKISNSNKQQQQQQSRKNNHELDPKFVVDNKSLIDDINRQTRLALQYSKQLEANLFRVEDLRAKYEMHLKMGLVVKSISRTYLTCSPNNSNSVSSISPNSSFARQQQLSRQHRHQQQQQAAHYNSSLMVNDSSSLGTRSSVSSLNLSTWSFSRSRRREQKDAEQQQQQQQQQQLNSQQSSFDSNDHHNNNNNNNNKLSHQQRYVSTISLDSHNKRNRGGAIKRRGLNLSKLISSTTTMASSKQKTNQPASAMHYIDQHSATLSRRPSQPHLMMCATQRPFSLMESDLIGDHYSNQDQRAMLDAGQPTKQFAYGDWEPVVNGSGDNPYDPTYPLGYHVNDPSLGYATATTISPTTTATMASDTLRSNSASLTKSQSHSSLKLIKSKGQLGSSGGNHSSQSKTTIKEFIENIERIESEFESYLGTFLLVIEDVQGFARVCQGDVFEISIKYGLAQKFKTKISVLKDNRQKCDHRQAIFKARVADVLAIKAYECKGLSKRVLLGHKLCETHDFFTARSQLMTISLNQTGSIKLNMVITWNPLVLTPNCIQ